MFTIPFIVTCLLRFSRPSRLTRNLLSTGQFGVVSCRRKRVRGGRTIGWGWFGCDSEHYKYCLELVGPSKKDFPCWEEDGEGTEWASLTSLDEAVEMEKERQRNLMVRMLRRLDKRVVTLGKNI